MSKHVFPKTLLALIVVLAALSTALAELPTRRSAASLARRAVEADSTESAIAVAELRLMGAEGLRAFLEANGSDIQSALKNRARTSGSKVLAALDSVCEQKDCHASRLYWHRDFDKAKAAARAEGKPILSLRLLGRLDEDLSCANSRLFRIALYSNQQVSSLLRERFVLHWQSVRPVPTITINFGDGRKMERTLTGNSIHYVIDSEGRVIDALPGMYGPGAFLRELHRISSAVEELTALRTDEERDAALRRYHQERLNELEHAWLNDVRRTGLSTAPSRVIPKTPNGVPPSAQTAAITAVSKAVMVERPILRGMSANPKLLDSIGGDAGWSMIAGLHAEDAILDRATRGLMSFKDPTLSGVKLDAAASALERAIAEDTVRNEYVFRTWIHRQLAKASLTADVASLNERIYTELFLTPSSDPWLGLRPAGGYSGIDDDGVRE